MWKPSLRIFSPLLVAVVAALSSCDRPSPSELARGPIPEATKVVGTDGHSYLLLKGQLSGPVGAAVKWIGPEGGTLTLTGNMKNGVPTAHVLVIPPLAVPARTKFTLRVASHTRLSVVLKAERKDLTGHLVDVGAAGFALPVTLTLSTAWATNLLHPAHVRILYDPANGNPMQLVPSVSSSSSLTVTATLSHFSKYAAAEN
jgi:hypothetical protein